LNEWQIKAHRKPLVLRGARQVGKSSLIRHFAAKNFKSFLEINVEAEPNIANLIVKRPVKESLELLSARYKKISRLVKLWFFLMRYRRDRIYSRHFAIGMKRCQHCM